MLLCSYSSSPEGGAAASSTPLLPASLIIVEHKVELLWNIVYCSVKILFHAYIATWRYLSSSAVSSSSNLHARRVAVCSFHSSILLWTCLSSASLAFSCLRSDAATPPPPPPSAPPWQRWASVRLLSSSMCSCRNSDLQLGLGFCFFLRQCAPTRKTQRENRFVPGWDAPSASSRLRLSPSSAVASGCLILAPIKVWTFRYALIYIYIYIHNMLHLKTPGSVCWRMQSLRQTLLSLSCSAVCLCEWSSWCRRLTASFSCSLNALRCVRASGTVRLRRAKASGVSHKSVIEHF